MNQKYKLTEQERLWRDVFILQIPARSAAGARQDADAAVDGFNAKFSPGQDECSSPDSVQKMPFLQSCPCCKGEPKIFVVEGSQKARIYCDACGLQTGVYQNLHHAGEAWNRRA